ncbi:hypothetical protein [Micromonospora sp. HM5-17]|nr:hypothetical protein [Micromonospora sp. HM5-17]
MPTESDPLRRAGALVDDDGRIGEDTHTGTATDGSRARRLNGR